MVFDLRAEDGGPLPNWAPGSHIELLLPLPGGEAVRPYSLCGEALEGCSWRIAVLREARSRGGSAYLCDQIEAGDVLLARGPNNRFAFAPAPRVRLLAGGIGIAPLLSMARTCVAQGRDWRLTYMARSAADMSLTRDLAKLPPALIDLHFSGSSGRLDLGEWAKDLDERDVVYACGPMRMLDDMELLQARTATRQPGRHWQLRLERFADPAEGQDETDDVQPHPSAWISKNPERP